jgi:hypothetical protein
MLMEQVERRLVRSKTGEMLIDAVLRRPEGAAIHQPRAMFWELVTRSNSQGAALGYRIGASLGRRLISTYWHRG